MMMTSDERWADLAERAHKPTGPVFKTIQELRDAYERGDRPTLDFAPHALRRGVQMADQLGLSPDEIRQTMLNPRHIGYSAEYSAVNLHGDRCTLAVILIQPAGKPCVHTILWGTADLWRASYETGQIVGRERRELDALIRSEETR